MPHNSSLMILLNKKKMVFCFLTIGRKWFIVWISIGWFSGKQLKVIRWFTNIFRNFSMSRWFGRVVFRLRRLMTAQRSQRWRWWGYWCDFRHNSIQLTFDVSISFVFVLSSFVCDNECFGFDLIRITIEFRFSDT